ncbi:hypothetical protein [Gynuella sunshinyii]|uniref:Uncharacterized protein n=1 Tax=Gynuella sunshinyii YC6258 TaxID=1445510 RepID=A0A0C5VHN1_9GAMM|nr:hypothetical protein [Gynuella sunshinyii]AJQ92858.1 hypothetical Protein YC6258_00808 [Gynuella sunshinyii YC6258]
MNDCQFIYQGSVKEGFTHTQVAGALAHLFGIPLSDALPLLSRTHQFVRRDISLEMAHAYQAAFEQCGAIGEVIEGSKLANSPQSDEDAVQRKKMELLRLKVSKKCPKCHSGQIVNGECGSCGIIVEKYINRLLAELDATEPKTSSFSQQDMEQQKERKRASLWLGAAAALTLLFGTIDEFLQGNIIFMLGYVDLGIWPYLLIHGILLRGCFLYAESKGYDSQYGYLGLLSYAGLAVLFWLPDQHNTSNKHTGGQKILALACIGVSVYWLIDTLGAQAGYEEHLQKAGQLAQGRHEYPSGVLDSDDAIYQQEWTELQTYIGETLKLLDDDSIRTSKAEQLSATLLDDIARYRIWKNYQTFLHVIQEKPLPPSLTYDQKSQEIRTLSSMFAQPTEDRLKPLALALSEWSTGTNMFMTGNRFWDDFNDYLMKMYQKYDTYQLIQRDDRNGGPPKTQITLADFSVLSNAKISVEKGDYTLTYSAPRGPLHDTPLTVAYYLEPYTRFGKTSYSRRVEIISYGLSAKHIQQMFNVLADIQPAIYSQ